MSLLVVITLFSDGKSALHHASKWGNDNAVDILLNAGADPNIVDE